MRADIPTEEQILKKINSLREGAKQAIEDKKKGISDVQRRLSLIKDIITDMRANGVSYRVIKKTLKDKINFSVSEQTISAFCKNVLDAEIVEDDSDDSEVQKMKKEVIKKKKNNEDTL